MLVNKKTVTNISQINKLYYSALDLAHKCYHATKLSDPSILNDHQLCQKMTLNCVQSLQELSNTTISQCTVLNKDGM